MKEIKILGTGCPKCKTTYKIIEEIAKANNFSGTIEKIEDISDIISYGIISTPAVVIDGNIAFTGDIPPKELIQSWFNTSPSSD